MGSIKILGNSIQLSAGVGTTVPDLNGIGAKYVLLQHVGENHHQIIQKTGMGTTVGSIHLPPDTVLTIKKERSDTLETASGNDVYVTSITYQG